MGFYCGPRFGAPVTDGLILMLDAADRNSYVSGSLIWNDISGNSYSGSLINGPTYSSNGGGSIVFDGVNDYVNLDSVRTQVLTYTSSVTFDIVFNMTQWVNNSYNGILVLGRNPDPGGGTECYLISFIDLSGFFTVQFGNSDGTPGPTISSTAQIQANTVYNFTMTYNNGTGSLYQNGSLANSVRNLTSTIYNTNQNNFYIGGDSRYIPGTSGRYFNGYVYNAKIYNRALSAPEVSQNFKIQKSRFGL